MALAARWRAWPRSTRRYLEENLAATTVTLILGGLAEIEGALPAGSAAGERCHEAGVRTVER